MQGTMKSPLIMLCNRHIKRKTDVMAKVRGEYVVLSKVLYMQLSEAEKTSKPLTLACTRCQCYLLAAAYETISQLQFKHSTHLCMCDVCFSLLVARLKRLLLCLSPPSNVLIISTVGVTALSVSLLLSSVCFVLNRQCDSMPKLYFCHLDGCSVYCFDKQVL